MTKPWAAWLPIDKAPTAAALRLQPGVTVRPAEDGVWLRGEALTEDVDRQLRKLPGAMRFEVTADGRLTPVGKRIASTRLPTDDWQALSSWIRPATQPAALAGQFDELAPIRLARSHRDVPASVLVTDFASWAQYALAAPAVRLAPLKFAATDSGRTVIRGTPVPPIGGVRLVERAGVAVPCGLNIVPQLDPASIRALLGTLPDDLALFAADGSWERIEAANFVSATRSAVRATLAAQQRD